jgi:hypothetical protein
MKQTLGRRLKYFDKIDDNNAVIRFIGKNSSNFNFIVTRRGSVEGGPCRQHTCSPIECGEFWTEVTARVSRSLSIDR